MKANVIYKVDVTSVNNTPYKYDFSYSTSVQGLKNIRDDLYRAMYSYKGNSKPVRLAKKEIGVLILLINSILGDKVLEENGIE